MVNKEFFQALDLFEREKKISKELLIESLESGLASAYKKEYGERSTPTVLLSRKSRTKTLRSPSRTRARSSPPTR